MNRPGVLSVITTAAAAAAGDFGDVNMSAAVNVSDQVTMTSANGSVLSSGDDNYAVWTARMREVRQLNSLVRMRVTFPR